VARDEDRRLTFSFLENSSYNIQMPKWRNWQTR
jgi:hypothetical protein